MRYVTCDLAEVREALGPHFRKIDQDTYTAACDECGEQLQQDWDCCPYCGTPVVWLNSPLWRRLFGSPANQIRRLSIVPPSEPSGVLLCSLAGVRGFANKTEAETWRRCLKKLSEARMKGIAEYAARGKRGRGVIAHALNLAEKIVREEELPEQAPRAIEVPPSWGEIRTD